MALPSYSTGTATVVAGGTSVALTDATTAFNNVFAGDTFCIGTASAKVIDIVDDENFTITPWPGSDETDAAYTVFQDSKLRFTDVEIALDLKKQVQFLNAQGYEIPVPDDMDEPDPTWGDDGQRALKTSATPWKIWLKVDGVWVLQPGSPGGPGAAATITVGTVTTVAAGEGATVTNSGTSSAAVLDFEIPEGADGLGVPAGGTTGQVLSKVSGTDNDTEWADPSGGGDVAGETHAATSKTTPVDADELPIVDSAASNVLKKLTWANLKAFFATAAQGTKADNALQGAFGFRNRLINPNGKVWQRANSGAAAITDGTYAFDRWYGLTQSAGVTASQVTNAENGTPYMMRLSQANATAQRLGIAQAIESANILDVRGKAVTLSARVRMSSSTTLRYAIIEWTGTADSITKDVVADWTNGTFTTGNFFNSTTLTLTASGSAALTANTLASINLTGTVSSSANNVIVFFWTDSTQAQNDTLDVGKVQLEIGSTATSLAVRSATEDLNDCMRYYFSSDNGSYIVPANTNVASQFKVRMRAVPSVTATPNAGTYSVNGSSVDAMFGSCTSLAAVAIIASAEL